MDCFYDAQGYYKCQNKKIIERFVDQGSDDEKKYDVQCGFLTSKYEAEDQCESCCGKNGLLWKGDYYNSKVDDMSSPGEMKTFCKCESNDRMTINADHELIVDPLVLERLNKKVWSLGELNLSKCVSRCSSLPQCKYLVHKDKQCWMSDVDPNLAQQTLKSGAFTVVKK